MSKKNRNQATQKAKKKPDQIVQKKTGTMLDPAIKKIQEEIQKEAPETKPEAVWRRKFRRL